MAFPLHLFLLLHPLLLLLLRLIQLPAFVRVVGCICFSCVSF
jgi:hypothetical protein